MSAILDSYDLSGGFTRSSVITGATYLNIQALLDNVAGRINFTVQRKQSTGDWVTMRDDNKQELKFGTSDSVEDAIDINGISGSSDLSISVLIEPIGDTSGTLTLDAITDGTVV